MTLGGELPGARGFADAYAMGANQVPVKIEELDAAGDVIRWEFALCTYTGTTLVRDSVALSSNNNAPVAFGSGIKRAFVFTPSALSVASYLHIQPLAATTWTIPHLQAQPPLSVRLLDSANQEFLHSRRQRLASQQSQRSRL
ncbi:hypothetical protein HC761_00225 [bacterium]|nr:hypothetical protein [bacterium]